MQDSNKMCIFDENQFMSSIYQFKVKGLVEGEIDFANFRGKKLMIVNVASECGFTTQYQQLQELHEECGERLQIIGFPCNDFGNQEPGKPAEIQAFCSKNYGVTFLLAAKISIKGSDPHPLYQWLTQKDKNGKEDSSVEWNFQKYLLNEEGQFEISYPSSKLPIDEDIVNWAMS